MNNQQANETGKKQHRKTYIEQPIEPNCKRKTKQLHIYNKYVMFVWYGAQEVQYTETE